MTAVRERAAAWTRTPLHALRLQGHFTFTARVAAGGLYHFTYDPSAPLPVTAHRAAARLQIHLRALSELKTTLFADADLFQGGALDPSSSLRFAARLGISATY